MPVFVDSNVIVYARDPSDPKKQERAEAWLRSLWASQEGRLSSQVLQESYVVMTGKLGVAEAVARAEITDLFAWKPIPVTTETVQAAWHLQDRHSLSFWDALIAAAAAASGCHRLLSEDLGHGATYGGVTVVDPFQEAPG